MNSQPSRVVRPGDEVLCELPPPLPLEAAPEDIAIEVVYEDEHLLVVNKPAHLVRSAKLAHVDNQYVTTLSIVVLSHILWCSVFTACRFRVCW